MFKCCVALCGLVLAVPVQAEDWRIVNWNDDFVLYVDHASISGSAGKASYASKVVFLRDEALTELHSRVEIRCDARQYRNLRISAVSKAGRVQAAKGSGTWRQVEPGTNVELEMRNACA